MRAKSLLAIDPGLGSTGYAFWLNGRLAEVGLVGAPRAGELPMRSLVLTERLLARLDDLDDDELEEGFGEIKVVIELPEFQGSVARSMGWRTGDLQSLVFLVGVMSGILAAWSGHTDGRQITLVKPSQWKGQLPKKLVIDRLRERLGAKRCEELGIEKDAWDAVGIGLWALGKF